MAEFVSKQRFEIVGARALRSGERGGSGVGGLAVVAEKGVGIEDLAGESGGAAGACRNSGGVRSDHAGEGEDADAGGESGAGLVEAACVEAVDVALLIIGAGFCGADAERAER